MLTFYTPSLLKNSGGLSVIQIYRRTENPALTFDEELAKKEKKDKEKARQFSGSNCIALFKNYFWQFILFHDKNVDKIQFLPVMLLIVSLDKEQIVSQSLSTTFSSVLKSSL